MTDSMELTIELIKEISDMELKDFESIQNIADGINESYELDSLKLLRITAIVTELAND